MVVILANNLQTCGEIRKMNPAIRKNGNAYLVGSINWYRLLKITNANEKYVQNSMA